MMKLADVCDSRVSRVELEVSSELQRIPVLSSLPEDILLRMQRFATEYLHGRMLTNYGVLPAKDHVLAARHWLERLRQEKASQTA
jgi:hypothetical protein